MKKLFLSMLLLTLHVHALTLSVNSANNNSEPFSILHIINDSEFECLAEELPHGKKAYSCVFEQEIITDVSDQATPSMDIKFVKFEDGFELIVLPKANSYIRPMGDRLFDDVDVHGTNISKKSKHWVVVVFQKIDFLKVNSEDGIDFPVEYSEFLKPSVGALDLNGAPIEYVGSKDINTFLDVKKLYERKDYESALSQAQEALMLYPDTIFKSELLLYKIRALDKVLQSENSYTELSESDLISDAKYWNNNIATEENMPEVLSYIVRNYIRMGFASEANYFLDILLTEYPSNKYTQMAIIYYADSLYGGSKKPEAVKLYNDVLYSTNDLDIASEAAIRLVKNSIDYGKVGEAKEYMLKIIGSNSKFLQNANSEIMYELAQKFANNEVYDIAAEISEALFKSKERSDDLYEHLLKDTGIWFSEAKDVQKADEYLKMYSRVFPYGEFKDDVDMASDKLFFELKETDNSKLKEYYDMLIERYNNEISEKALVEKMKILYEEQSYLDMLALDESVKNIANAPLLLEGTKLLKDGASKQSNIYFSKDDCASGVRLIERYELVNSSESSEKYFECMLRGSRYKDAKNEAIKYINDRDLRNRLAWLKRLSKAMLALGEYESVAKVSDDILSLGILVKDPNAKEILYDKFDALVKAKKEQEALLVTQEIEKEFPNSYKNVDIYDKIVTYARSRGNDLLLEIYAKKIIDQQRSSNIFVKTPSIELEYIEALQRLNKLQDALDVVVGLKEYYSESTPQINYYGGELNFKLGNTQEAKTYFEECAKVSGAWQSICEQSLNLIK